MNRAGTLSPASKPPPSWRLQWAVFTALGAAGATALDAVLLERKYGILTGGFQAADQLKSTATLLGFITASLIADATVIGVLVAVALWIASHTRLTRAARILVILAMALTPIVVADFVSYELLKYLGDTFEFWTIFRLAGNSPREVLAVVAGHLAAPVKAVIAGLVLVGFVVWILDRYFPESPREPAAWASARARLLLLAAVCGIGLGTTCIARINSDVLDDVLQRKFSSGMLGHIVDVITDFDRDGYGLLSRPRDPEPWNPQVHPYAVDIPGNGIDEDGVAGDLPLQALALAPAQNGPDPGRWQFKPDVLVFFLESVRADVIGSVHNGRPVTPVLDRLASQGVSSKLAFSHNGWTAQSRYHFFSGDLATIPGCATLVDDFKANGYQVGYFSGQVESFGGSDLEVGFARADVSYDARDDINRRYTLSTSTGSLAVPLSLVQERVNGFLEHGSSTKPLFLYVNYGDTHFPYYHPGIRPLLSSTIVDRSDIGPDRVSDLRSMYLNTVANVDQAIGEVLSKVRRVRGKDPAVIVMSDHGESLFEEGFLGHGYALNDAQTRVPFIAANLPIVVTEPFIQADFRGALRAALTTGGGRGQMPQAPAIRRDASRTVFQYLGTIERPSQIALTAVTGRTIYDFRKGRVKVGEQSWRLPEELNRQERDSFQQLVWFWETQVWRGAQSRTAAKSKTK